MISNNQTSSPGMCCEKGFLKNDVFSFSIGQMKFEQANEYQSFEQVPHFPSPVFCVKILNYFILAS